LKHNNGTLIRYHTDGDFPVPKEPGPIEAVCATFAIAFAFAFCFPVPKEPGPIEALLPERYQARWFSRLLPGSKRTGPH